MHDYVQKSLDSGKECVDILTENRVISSACELGEKDKKPSYILFGDSHARSLASALGDISNKLNISGLNYSFTSCPPLLLGNHVKQSAKHKTCTELRNDFFNNLNNSEIPNFVILLQRWSLMMEKNSFDNEEGGHELGEEYLFTNNYTNTLGYEVALEKDYVESVKRILDSGRTVILVYPIPEMGWNVPDFLMKKYLINKNITSPDASTSHSVFKKRNLRSYQALDSIGEHENLIRVIPEKLFCDNYSVGRCIAHIDGVPLYSDDDHLSYIGAKLLAEEIFKKTNNFKGYK